jgi:hypothetical protein
MLTLEATLVPATRDLGDGFKVRRALPSIKWRTISEREEERAPSFTHHASEEFPTSPRTENTFASLRASCSACARA